MKRSSRTQQSEFARTIIRKAKKMIDDGVNYKEVLVYIKKEFEEDAKNNHNFFDNIQYQKAVKSVIDYI